jgi:hypothetical protein
MLRLRVFFALLLLALLLPVWRLQDLLLFFWPSATLYALGFMSTFLIFLGLPVRLVRPELKTLVFLPAALLAALLGWWGAPFSGADQTQVEARHCGFTSYTGFFYGARGLMPEAQQDDLELRNQLCWIKKMTIQLPRQFDDSDQYESFIKDLELLLLRPENKYRASLPLIALLYGHLAFRFDGKPWETVSSGKIFLESLTLWRQHYTTDISARSYGWWNWPLSGIMRLEYGLVERNWEYILDNVRIETN